MFLGKVAFVLTLKINAPLHRILELLAAVLQNFDGIGVVHLSKIRIDEVFQTVDGLRINSLAEELHVITTLFKNSPEYILEHVLGKTGVVVKIIESNLRLHHPEFGKMPGGVGVFSAESGAEGVNL